MSAENDLMKLYSARILAHAADIPHTARLADPDATVTRRSPLCGSTITVDVQMQGGRLSALGQDVKACALGQAAAAIAGAAATGCSTQTLTKARDELRAMLKGGPVPAAPFDGFEVLTPAVAYKNRHASILLAIESLAEAATKADARIHSE